MAPRTKHPTMRAFFYYSSRWGPGAAAETSSGARFTVAEWHDEFVALVAAAAPPAPEGGGSGINRVEAKAANAANGLETSTFTVCARLRPRTALDGVGGESFVCALPGPCSVAPSGEVTEAVTVLRPKVASHTRVGTPEWAHPSGHTRVGTPEWAHPSGPLSVVLLFSPSPFARPSRCRKGSPPRNAPPRCCQAFRPSSQVVLALAKGSP